MPNDNFTHDDLSSQYGDVFTEATDKEKKSLFTVFVNDAFERSVNPGQRGTMKPIRDVKALHEANNFINRINVHNDYNSCYKCLEASVKNLIVKGINVAQNALVDPNFFNTQDGRLVMGAIVPMCQILRDNNRINLQALEVVRSRFNGQNGGVDDNNDPSLSDTFRILLEYLEAIN